MSFYFATRTAQQQQSQRMYAALGCSAFALLTAFVAIVVLSSQSAVESEALAPAPLSMVETTVQVVVPLSRLAIKDRLSSVNFTLKTIPLSDLKSGMIQNMEEVENRYALTPLIEGFPILREQISSQAPANDIRDRIRPGMRAVAIKVDKITSVDAWVAPGAKVDVSLIGRRNGSLMLIPIVQNIEILDVDRREPGGNGQPGDPPGAVTLQATPEEANSIQLAQQSGLLTLTLRGTINSNEIVEYKPIKETGLWPDNQKQDAKCEGEFSINGEIFCLENNRFVQKETDLKPPF